MSGEAYKLPETRPEPMEPTLETIGIMKTKRAKKQVSYHVSVPIEKSPLGPEGYREIPSDTDTTSCFDSDGTYMRSEGQSSDSGAALLQHSREKKKGRDKRFSEAGIIKGSRKKFRKAKHIIRSHEDFFMVYDTKHWANARKFCFWFSVLSIVASIVAA